MSPVKNPFLKDHFDQLKSLVTEVYKDGLNSGNAKADALFELLRNSLRVIEAVYVQNPELFTRAKAETYANIVVQLEKLGIRYEPNKSILLRANIVLTTPDKKPMERAKSRSTRAGSRKAG
jgi:hypothetical protein